MSTTRTERNPWRRLLNAQENARYHHRYRDWYGEPTMTAKRAREILACAESHGLVGMSRVNRQFTKSQVHEIMERSIKDVPDETPIRAEIAKNIGREFGKDYMGLNP